MSYRKTQQQLFSMAAHLLMRQVATDPSLSAKYRANKKRTSTIIAGCAGGEGWKPNKTAQASHPGRFQRDGLRFAIRHTRWQGARLLRSPRSWEHEFQHAAVNLPIHSHRFMSAVQSRLHRPDSLRRPQRPGNPARVAAFLETLPAVHPRELPGTTVILRCSSKLKTTALA